jgi:hypothetical protein
MCHSVLHNEPSRSYHTIDIHQMRSDGYLVTACALVDNQQPLTLEGISFIHPTLFAHPDCAPIPLPNLVVWTCYIQRTVLELRAHITIDLRQASPAQVSPLLFGTEDCCRHMKWPEKRLLRGRRPLWVCRVCIRCIDYIRVLVCRKFLRACLAASILMLNV